ncbi:MAG: translocase FtsK, partial [Gemmataceae bacterium]|nr:translocase FtsK [Gemmataceae bacterium]
MSDPKVPPPRWRLDAIALTLFAVGGLLAVAVGSARALFGGPNLLGDPGDRTAAYLVDPLGWGALVFLAGWFALTALLVATRHPGRIAARLAGWTVLTTCAAAAADWSGSKLSPASVAGPGGSVGAFVRFTLEDVTEPPWDWAAFAVSAAAGVLFTADWLVTGLGRAVGALLRRLWTAAAWGNGKVAAGSEQVLAGLGTVAKVVGRGAAGAAK